MYNGHFTSTANTALPLPAALKVSASSPSKTAGRKRARYQFRPPRFYRGPFSPVQPPKPSAPNSRLFVPGPFTSERLQDHYYTTLAPDLLTMTYVHLPKGYQPRDYSFRHREWDDSSPYHAGRGTRPPPGRTALYPAPRPRTHRNLPKLTGITVHTMVRDALKDSAFLHAAGMVVQSITGARASVHYSKVNIAAFELRAQKACAVTSTVKGPLAYRFMSSLIDVVLPRIKDYDGVSMKSGDSTGNISFGFTPEAVSLFPEIEVNYDMYPPKMVPGLHVTVHTSARTDRDAKLLLMSMGVPFTTKGKSKKK
ncbi:ribosomal protein L5 domain-containing protein [Morchella snyderi]|nr:ribosomal protein L5 domain-containing protein [Morchella snyderi]